MYRLILGKISTLILSSSELPSALMELAPDGTRRVSWLAGRILLNSELSPLPEIIYGKQGKPAFNTEAQLWFNLSHSGDDIALLLSDEGEVGCDIEVVRPFNNWRALANDFFSLGELAEIESEHPDRHMSAFWRIWTCKEAILKQRGDSVWQIGSIDSTSTPALMVNHCQIGSLSLAVCTPTAFILRDKDSYNGLYIYTSNNDPDSNFRARMQ